MNLLVLADLGKDEKIVLYSLYSYIVLTFR